MPEKTQPQVKKQDKARGLNEALGRVVKSLIFRDGPPPWLADLPISQLRCWFQIAENEGLRMHDLVNSMGVKLPAISQMVDRLVRRGLVERKPAPEDRRAVRLFMTETARARHLESKAAHLAKVEETSSMLDSRTIEDLIGGLNRLADAAEELNGAACSFRQTRMDAESEPETDVKKAYRKQKNRTPVVSPSKEWNGQIGGKSAALAMSRPKARV